MGRESEKEVAGQSQNVNNDLNGQQIETIRDGLTDELNNLQDENRENQRPRPATIRMFIERQNQTQPHLEQNNNNQHTR